jgi:hypothetical protein
MSDTTPEILVLAEDATVSATAWRHLEGFASVTGRMPPRLALARPWHCAGELPPIDGLAYVRREDPDPEGLTEAEQLFVDGWRQRLEDKTRVGDGLAWDTPGYTAPDLPAR